MHSRTLATDIETFSSVDLKKCGLHKYVESDDFEILMLSFSFDDDPVTTIDLANGETLPPEYVKALFNTSVLKTAANASFEITCLSKYLGQQLPADQWFCTLVRAGMLGLPMALGATAKVLGLADQKDKGGELLIKYFSVPCKPTKTNSGRTRNFPYHDPVKWASYKAYNKQDVIVEKAILKKVGFMEVPEMEKRVFALDQKINNRGVKIDVAFVKNAIEMDAIFKARLTEEAISLTGLDNPNSVDQLKEWLSKEMEEEIETLTKDDVPALINSCDSEIVKRVLVLRQKMSKTSVKKFITMLKYVLKNDRMCGLLQYYGANRTARWAGRGVQLHNLPQNKLKNKYFDILDYARKCVVENDLAGIGLIFDSLPEVLSQLIRTAIIADEGKVLGVADFSAIEARIIAWLANEKWRQEVFQTHGKIYEASAARMFKVPLESITKTSPLRQRGKVAELALGYQGAVNALIKMGALEMGIPESELQGIVDVWRQENQKIVQLWADVQDAAITAIKFPGSSCPAARCMFKVEKGCLFITLPSGRKLSYIQPRLGVNQWGSESIEYMGMNQTTKRWEKQTTYGGKLVENITQAIARDALAEALLNVDAAGYDLVMHVHDELVVEMLKNENMNEIDRIMSQPIPWAPGLLLKVDSFQTNYYKKD